MVFESQVVDLLNKFAGQYLENLDSSQLRIGIWGGGSLIYDLGKCQTAWTSFVFSMNRIHVLLCFGIYRRCPAGKFDFKGECLGEILNDEPEVCLRLIEGEAVTCIWRHFYRKYCCNFRKSHIRNLEFEKQ